MIAVTNTEDVKCGQLGTCGEICLNPVISSPSLLKYLFFWMSGLYWATWKALDIAQWGDRGTAPYPILSTLIAVDATTEFSPVSEVNLYNGKWSQPLNFNYQPPTTQETPERY